MKDTLMILILWPVHIKGTQSSFVSHLRIITTLTSNSIGQLCPLSFFIHMESYQKSVSVGAWLSLLNIVLWDSPMLLRNSVDCTFSLGYSIELCLGLIYKWQVTTWRGQVNVTVPLKMRSTTYHARPHVPRDQAAENGEYGGGDIPYWAGSENTC